MAKTPSLNSAAISNGANPSESPSEEWLWWESAKVDPPYSGRVDLAGLPDRLVEDSRDTLLRADNMTALLLAGGASVAMHDSDADKNLSENFSRHRAFHGFADEGLNVIGSPTFHFPATGLWYAVSAENQDELNKQRD